MFTEFHYFIKNRCVLTLLFGIVTAMHHLQIIRKEHPKLYDSLKFLPSQAVCPPCVTWVTVFVLQKLIATNICFNQRLLHIWIGTNHQTHYQIAIFPSYKRISNCLRNILFIIHWYYTYMYTWWLCTWTNNYSGILPRLENGL